MNTLIISWPSNEFCYLFYGSVPVPVLRVYIPMYQRYALIGPMISSSASLKPY
jgi:hypothetical protein